MRGMSSLFVIFSLALLFLRQTQAADTLSPGQNLTDGNTLVSAGNVFDLGFFSPNTSTNRYVGIWYHNFSTDTVLWVANRDLPIMDKSGSLTIAEDGNLVLVDGARNLHWSTKVPGLSANQTTAKLAGMRVGLDLTTNVNQVFTSWKSSIDPAVGRYSMGTDRSKQIYIWEGKKPRWRSGRWDGQDFLGSQDMDPLYIYNFMLSNYELERKIYFYYTAFNASHRYVLTWDGILKHLVWDDDTKV